MTERFWHLYKRLMEIRKNGGRSFARSPIRVYSPQLEPMEEFVKLTAIPIAIYIIFQGAVYCSLPKKPQKVALEFAALSYWVMEKSRGITAITS